MKVFERGGCPGFLSERFCPGWFLSGSHPFCQNLTEYIHNNRKLNITFNFRFHMYERIFKSVTSHALGPRRLCHKLSHLLGPLASPSSVTYLNLWTAPNVLCYVHNNKF